METQYTRISMTPSGVPPVFYMSQYDIGRPVGFICDADLSNYMVTLEATRTDGTPVLVGVTVDGNIGAFATTATMTNKEDDYPAQIVISADGERIASIHIRMHVVKAVMDENAESIEEDASLYQQYTGTVQALIADIRADITANTNSITALDTKLSADNYLRGKSIVVYGDSSGTYAGNFVDMLSDYGLTVTNRCIGGTTMSIDNSSGECGLTRLTAATDLDDFDVCLIVYSINDWQTSAYPDAYRNAYDSVCKIFAGTTCEPIFIFPWYCHITRTWSDYGWTMDDANLLGIDLPCYIDNAIDIVTQYGYKYINLYTAAGVNVDNYTDWLVNNGGVYVHSLSALSERVCRIITAGIFNNGKFCNFSGPNLAGMLYNNITLTNINTNYTFNGTLGLMFEKATTANPVAIMPVDDTNVTDAPVVRFRIRGTARQSVTRMRLVARLGSTYRYICIPGTANFDFCVTGSGNLWLYMDFPSDATSVSIAEIFNLEVYCDRQYKPSFFNMTMQSGVTSAVYAGCFVRDGSINFTPVDLTIGSALSAGQYVMKSPLTINGIGVTTGILKHSGTVSYPTVYNVKWFICCSSALSAGDQLSFQFPPVPITATYAQHG